MRKVYFILSVVFLLLMQTASQAQPTVQASVDKTTIIPGEPIALTVQITGDQKYTATLGDTIGVFEILKTPAVATKQVNGATITDYSIWITAFDTGKFVIPGIALAEVPAAVSTPLEITVASMPPGTVADFHDVKELDLMPAASRWPKLLALAGALLLATLGWWFWRRRKKEVTIVKAPDTASVISLLSQLKEKWQRGQVDAAQLGLQLLQHTRSIVTASGIQAESLTGTELMLHTRDIWMTSHWQQAAQAIRLSEAAAFGKYAVPVQEGLQAIEGISQVAIVVQKTIVKEEKA